jgi:hypothetical protein
MLAVNFGLSSPDFKANPCIFGQKANDIRQLFLNGGIFLHKAGFIA